jgi:uncharacterized membrane protein
MKKILRSFLLIITFSSIQAASAASDIKTANTVSENFDVIDIKQGSSLKMRMWPSLTSEVVVAIPHNAQSLTYKGSKVKQGKKMWKKVYWNNNEGWVNAKHLQQHKKTTSTIVKQPPEPVAPPTPIKTQAPTKKPSTTTNPSTTNEKHTILACGGSAPFWNIHMDLTNKKIQVNLQDGKSFTTSLNNRKWDVHKNEMLITGGEGQQAINALLSKTNTCTDGLTTLKYPFTAHLTIGDTKKIKGCCRTIQK